jgi:hypothetical protein
VHWPGGDGYCPVQRETGYSSQGRLEVRWIQLQSSESTGAYCKVGSQAEGTEVNTLSWTAHATAASIVNGSYIVTKLEGTTASSNVITKKAANAGCAAVVTLWSENGTLDVSRQ